MPYSSNSELPESVRSRYSDNCQSVWRHTFNSVLGDYQDEHRAFASATGQANKCQEKKSMAGIRTGTIEPRFKIFAPMLKASMGSDGKRRLHGIASSTIKDRHGDTMALSALSDMERSASNNLTIFLNHSYNVPEDVAGYVERAAVRQHPQDLDIHDLALDIVVNETNDRAIKAWEAIDGGTQLGLSIGAMIPDGGATRDRKSGAYQIDHVELLETSLVGVPANPRSWVEYAVKSLHGVEEPIELAPGEEATLVSYGPVQAPDIEKAPMSSEHRTNLPDSAFACPEKRKYPHHTSSGAVDKAHLRNALSRCGDKSNDQCGCAHVRAHASKLGIGGDSKDFKDLLVFALGSDFDEAHFEIEADELEHTDDPPLEDEEEEEDEAPEEETSSKALGTVTENSAGDTVLTGTNFDPDTTNATVNIETPFANITVDTGNRGGSKPAEPVGEASQEAHLSAPETEDQDDTSEDLGPWAGILPVQSALDEPDVTAALQVLEPSVVASLRNSTELLKAITRELIDTKQSLEDRNAEYLALEEMTKEVIANTGRILDKLSNTPVGRRAVIREVNEQFASLSGVYSEDFLTILKRK